MLYVKAACGNCGRNFEIYSREINRRDDPIRCPHCLRQMEPRHWDNLINAYMTTADWNYQNIKAHTEHGSPLFQVEFVSKHVPQAKILASLELGDD